MFDSEPNRRIQVHALGTAMWGWTTSKADAFGCLDLFYRNGGRMIDCAENYPINGVVADFGLAGRWLREWIAAHAIHDLHVIMKVGGTSNTMGDDPLLSQSYILMTSDINRARYGANLGTIAVHWDNRDASRRSEIQQTLQAMLSLSQAGIGVGVSGISAVELYGALSSVPTRQWLIQVKSGPLSPGQRERYIESFPDSRYFGYGLNDGGVKLGLETAVSRPLRRPGSSDNFAAIEALFAAMQGLPLRPRTFNELALSYASLVSRLDGIILGARTPDQLDSSLRFLKALSSAGNSDRQAIIQQLRPLV